MGAICTKERCEWKIYCSVEKPKGKWMVKSYVDKDNHLKSSKARMLKQGTIARLYKDEARRRPGIKWTDIKDEIMMRYNLSGCYIAPFSGRVFDVWGPGPQGSQEQPPQDS